MNWAATILYYSIVHSSRFLIFVPVGDFPKAHECLGKCFDPQKSPVSTNWLKGFAAAGIDADRKDYSQQVSYRLLSDSWEKLTGASQSSEFFKWLGRAIGAARQLRNDNNYEALLIAHEYKHVYLADIFCELATALKTIASRTLREITALWSKALDSQEDREFVSSYLHGRILEPIRSWHSAEIQSLVGSITKKLVCTVNDSGRIEEIERNIDFEIFYSKQSLMSGFRLKVEHLLDISKAEFRNMPDEIPHESRRADV